MEPVFNSKNKNGCCLLSTYNVLGAILSKSKVLYILYMHYLILFSQLHEGSTKKVYFV